MSMGMEGSTGGALFGFIRTHKAPNPRGGSLQFSEFTDGALIGVPDRR